MYCEKDLANKIGTCINSHTSFLSPDGDDSGIGTPFHCEGQDCAVVDVEGVKRPHCDLCRGRISGQLAEDVGLSFCHVNSVLPDYAVHVLKRWGAPVQEDVGGV